MFQITSNSKIDESIKPLEWKVSIGKCYNYLTHDLKSIDGLFFRGVYLTCIDWNTHLMNRFYILMQLPKHVNKKELLNEICENVNINLIWGINNKEKDDNYDKFIKELDEYRDELKSKFIYNERYDN